MFFFCLKYYVSVKYVMLLADLSLACHWANIKLSFIFFDLHIKRLNHIFNEPKSELAKEALFWFALWFCLQQWEVLNICLFDQLVDFSSCFPEMSSNWTGTHNPPNFASHNPRTIGKTQHIQLFIFCFDMWDF